MAFDDAVRLDPRTLGVMSRRAFMVGVPLALAACQTTGPEITGPLREALDMYGPVLNEPFPVPAVDLFQIPQPFWRATILTADMPSHIPERPGEIVVDPDNRYLYRIKTDGTTDRYGVGVGREGFGWSGRATIQRKEEWPTWTPTAAMVARDPAARPWAGGMPGGPPNPLGARAMYLYQNGRDTLYRLHGTNQPTSIGQALSSGCIRMLNQDVIHLYNQTPLGTAVTVLT